VSRWTYVFRPDGDATVVTETWRDSRPWWFTRLTEPAMGVNDVRAHHQANIRKTLANLRAAGGSR